MAVQTPGQFVREENNSNYLTCHLDDALALTGLRKYNFYRLLMCGALTMLAVGTEEHGYSFILPASQCDLKLSLIQRGWLAGIPSLGLTSTLIFWGYLADTQGRRRVMIPALFFNSVFSLMLSFSPSLPIFAVLKLSSSVSSSAVVSTLLTYFTEFVPKKNVASMVSIYLTIYCISSTFSSLIAWGVLSLDFRLQIDFLGIEYTPWRLLVVCFSVPSILALLVMLKASESPKYLMAQGKNDEALKILQSIYAVNTGNKESDFPVKELLLDETEELCIKYKSLWDSVVDRTTPLLRPPFLQPILTFSLVSFGIGWCAGSFSNWMPDILDRFYFGYADGDGNKNFCQVMGVRSELRHNNSLATNESKSSEVCVVDLEPSTYKFMMMLSGLTGAIHLALLGLLHIVSKKTVLLTMLSLDLIFSFIMELIYNKVLIWTGVFFFVISGIVVAVAKIYVMEFIPTKHKSMTKSILATFLYVGAIVGTNLLGYLIENNCSIIFYLYGVMFSVCLISSIFLPIKLTVS